MYFQFVILFRNTARGVEITKTSERQITVREGEPLNLFCDSATPYQVMIHLGHNNQIMNFNYSGATGLIMGLNIQQLHTKGEGKSGILLSRKVVASRKYVSFVLTTMSEKFEISMNLSQATNIVGI